MIIFLRQNKGGRLCQEGDFKLKNRSLPVSTSYLYHNLKRTLDYHSAKSGCLLFLFNINGSVRKTILSGVCSIIKTLIFLIIFIPITVKIGMIDHKRSTQLLFSKGVNFGLHTPKLRIKNFQYTR